MAAPATSPTPAVGNSAEQIPSDLPDLAPPVIGLQSRQPLQLSVENLPQLDAWAAENVRMPAATCYLSANLCVAYRSSNNKCDGLIADLKR